jgi:hypothetical protein
VKWYRGKHDLVRRAYTERDAWPVARLGLARRALAAAGGWQIVHPGGRTGCARGGKYAFWARVARPDRVLFFFQGGGGCFDVRTCAPGSTWFDDWVANLAGGRDVGCPACRSG